MNRNVIYFAPDIDESSVLVFGASLMRQWDTRKTTRRLLESLSEVRSTLTFLECHGTSCFQLFMAFDTPPKSKPSLQRSMRNCLQVLSQLASSVDVSLAEKTSCDLQKLISEFSLPPEIIGPAITALTATTIASCRDSSEESQNQAVRGVDSFSIQMLRRQNLLPLLVALSPTTKSLVLLVLFSSVGELSMVGFSASEDSGGGAGPSTTAQQHVVQACDWSPRTAK